MTNLLDTFTEHSLRRGMWRLVDAGLGRIEDIEERWPIERFFDALSYLGAKAAEEARVLKEAQARAGG